MRCNSTRLGSVMGLALALGLLTAPDADAQSAKKIIVLGSGNSAVVSGVAKTRTRLDAKELVRAARERKEKLGSAEEERAETKKRLKAQLADVDAVAADLSAQGTSEDDGLLVESALEAGVPVVLENTDSAKMAQLTGAVGMDAKTVVIETLEGGGQFNITIVDGPEPTVKSGPEEHPKSPEKPAAPSESVKKALEQYEAKQKAAAANQPKPERRPVIAKLTGAQKQAMVETLISEKAFKKGAKRHALITGTCGTGVKCKEGQMNVVVQFCPGDLCSAYSTLAPVVEWGVYKTISQNPTTGANINTAHIITRAAGRPNLAMMWDATRDRGFYLDSWNIKFEAAYPANMGWVLDKATPENANKQVSVAYSTGFTVGGTSPNVVNVSYSSTQTRTMNTEEFGITRSTTTNSVNWANKMQLDGLGESYSVPNDLFIYWFMSSTDVAMVPTIAKYGTDFRAEATWYGKREAACGQCIVTISPFFSLQMYHAFTTPIPMDQGTYWEKTVNPFAITATVPPIKFVTSW
jgi:hypothetical protein